MTKPYFLNPQNEEDLQWKTTSKYKNWNINASTVWIVTYEFLGGNKRNTQRKSRVWLCSAQLVVLILFDKVIRMLGLQLKELNAILIVTFYIGITADAVQIIQKHYYTVRGQ